MPVGDADQSLTPGASLGTYVLGDRIAAGGMADVYHARSLGRRFDRPIVLKHMHAHLARNRAFVEMFIDEARITTRLEHPNIVQVFDFEATEGGLYLIMELVDGPDLLAVLKRCAQLRCAMPPELATYTACHVLEGLDYAHGAKANDRHLGIVHRDVSPSNILVTRRGQVKLADFGIARAAERQQETAPGTLKGKYGYMSPEQVQGEPVDARSDIFAMGIVLAEMLIGRRLFAVAGDPAGSGAEVEPLLMVRRADLSRLDKYGAHIPPRLDDIVRRALRPDRNHRFASAAAFRDALAEWLSQSSRRCNAQTLAGFLDELKRSSQGCEVDRRPSSDVSSAPTLTGTDSRVARQAVKDAVRAGREAFATVRKPADPDIVDALEIVSSPPDPPGGPIDLEGRFGALLPIQVFERISQRRLTGILTMIAPPVTRIVYFDRGAPELVCGDAFDERLDRYLLRRNLLTQDQLQRALGALGHFSGLGQALVSLRLLQPIEAIRLLEDHHLYKLVESCSWRDGTFSFHVDTAPRPEVSHRIAITRLINRGLSAVPHATLTEWARQHSHERLEIPSHKLASFDLEPPLRDRLLQLASDSLADAVKRASTALDRNRLVAASYIVWRCGLAAFASRRH